jgi:hypothetical protein
MLSLVIEDKIHYSFIFVNDKAKIELRQMHDDFIRPV